MSINLYRIACQILPLLLLANLGFSQYQIRDSTVSADMKLYLVALGDDTRVIVMPVCKKKMDGIQFIHVHEDEATAAEAAIEFIDSAGTGCFVTLKHGMGRNISFNQGGKTYKFDPNRMFTAEGRKISLQGFGNFSDSAFAAVTTLSNFITSRYIDSNRLIVALHNNTNEGGLSIRSYQKGGAYAKEASKVFVSKTEDEDNFFYTTTIRAFDFFKERGFNVMLQSTKNVTDDGSLSVYAGMKKLDYINIEAQHLSKDQQKKMLAVVMDYISIHFPPKPVPAGSGLR